jgi:hypothetical protein
MCRERCRLTGWRGGGESRFSAPTWSSTPSSSRAAGCPSTRAAVLPPALAPPQRYISPLVGSGNVRRSAAVRLLSRPPPRGDVAVLKQVQAPDGVPVTPYLPHSRRSSPASATVADPLRSRRWTVISPGPRGLPPGPPPVVEKPAAVVVYTPVGANSRRACHHRWRWHGRHHHQRLLQRQVQRAIRFEGLAQRPGVEPPPTFTVGSPATTHRARRCGTGGRTRTSPCGRCRSVPLPEDPSLPAGWIISY